MPIEEIKKVCFVGAGTMGCFNSLVTAIAGYEVNLYDVSQESLDMSEERQRVWGEALIERDFTTADAVEEGLTRIKRTTDAAEAAAEADLLSESVFEQVDLKRETHEKFEKLLPPHAIMTTNTSTILLSDIESAVENGKRFAAMHFHQPGRLVDLVASPRTSPETIETLKRFVRSQNQVGVVLKKEKGGYIHNTLYGAMLSTAMALHYTSAGTHQEIDQAWILNQRSYVDDVSKVEAGPFGMMDYVGLNVVYDGIEGILKKDEEEGLLHDQKKEIIQGIVHNLKKYIDRGDLGMKTGKGFYSYPDPEYLNADFLEGVTENKDFSDPIINAILKQSILLVVDGICDVEDVDLSWMLTHSPAIGPFGIMDDRGIDLVSAQLKDQAAFLEAMFGKDDPDLDELKRATDYLDDMIKKGETGKKSGKGFYSYPNPAYAKEGFIP
jgi:3-hydroxybutyryl-CoA dehydrogenase